MAGVRDASFYGVASVNANNSTEIAAWLAYLAANGGRGILDVEGDVNMQTQVTIDGAAKPFSIIGQGKGVTVLKRNAAIATPLRIFNSPGVEIHDLTMHGNFSGFATNASHGFVGYQCNDLVLENVKITDYKDTAALLYADTPYTYYGNVVENSECDGLGVANNGWFLSDLDRSAIRHSVAKGATGSPGYGLQLKNRCRWSSIENSFVQGCDAGVALGQDISAMAHQFCRVNDVIIYDCITPFIAGFSYYCTAAGLVIDQNDLVGYSVDLTSCIGLSVDVSHLSNVPSNRTAAVFRAGTQDSIVHIRQLVNHDNASIATFVGGSSNNHATVDHWLGATRGNMYRYFDRQMRN